MTDIDTTTSLEQAVDEAFAEARGCEFHGHVGDAPAVWYLIYRPDVCECPPRHPTPFCAPCRARYERKLHYCFDCPVSGVPAEDIVLRWVPIR